MMKTYKIWGQTIKLKIPKKTYRIWDEYGNHLLVKGRKCDLLRGGLSDGSKITSVEEVKFIGKHELREALGEPFGFYVILQSEV